MPGDGKKKQAGDRDRSRPVRVRRLGSEGPESERLDELTPRARLELVHELSLRMWELTGRPEPTYGREEMQVRVVRRR